MGMQIEREVATRSYTCPTGTPTAAQMLDCSGASGISIFVPTGLTVATLTFYGMNGNPDISGGRTPIPIYNNSNAAVTLTVTNGRCYWAPEELFAFPFIGIKGDVGDAIIIAMKK